jgi:hypothetical protein
MAFSLFFPLTFSLSCLGDDIDIKCYDISAHLGNLERDWFTVLLRAFLGYRRQMIPRRRYPARRQSYEGDE